MIVEFGKHLKIYFHVILETSTLVFQIIQQSEELDKFIKSHRNSEVKIKDFRFAIYSYPELPDFNYLILRGSNTEHDKRVLSFVFVHNQELELYIRSLFVALKLLSERVEKNVNNS